MDFYAKFSCCNTVFSTNNCQILSLRHLPTVSGISGSTLRPANNRLRLRPEMHREERYRLGVSSAQGDNGRAGNQTIGTTQTRRTAEHTVPNRCACGFPVHPSRRTGSRPPASHLQNIYASNVRDYMMELSDGK